MVAIDAAPILDAPCPRVGVTVTGLSAGEQAVSIWRTAGGDRVAVRGARGVPVVDSFYVVDYEAPLGQLVTYDLEVVAGADYGTQGVSATVTVDSECGFIQDPLDPASAVRVWGGRQPGGEATLRPASFSEIAYKSTSSQFNVMGATRPVAISGHRMAGTGIPLEMVTRAEAENTRLRDLVRQSTQLIIRPLPGWSSGLPGSATYLAETVTEKPRRNLGAHTTWTTTGDIVRGASSRVLVALFTYQDVEELFLTYNDKQSASGGGTYLDDLKSPDGSGN